MKKRSLIKLLFITLISLAYTGCHDHVHEEEAHHHEANSVTIWTDSTELFMEYPPLVTGQESAFAVHLSNMKNFKPVTEGSLQLIFKEISSGNELTFNSDSPSHPGIFRPVVTMREPGTYNLTLRLNSKQVSDVLTIDDVVVYKDTASIPHEEDQASGEEEISFLKEQQWKIEFETEPAAKHKLSGSITAVGELLPKPQMHAEVPAPVNGVILADQSNVIPSIGTWVNKGTVLAVISPPANAGSGFIDIRNEFLLAKSEFERAERLLQRNAIPQKRFEEIKLKYEAKKASYDVIEKQIDLSSLDKDGNNGFHLHLTAPIDGYLEAIHFHIGETVTAGQKLFTVSNPAKVLLKVNVPLSKIDAVKDSKDASFKVESFDEEFRVSELNGRLISIGSIVNEQSRTVPVHFEVNNPSGKLKIGMFVQADIKTGKPAEVLAIPNTAVFEENGQQVAYVHLEGETFAKRLLKTGIKDKGYTEVLEGIEPGERVVTVGGYQVKLASMSTSVPTGHGHEH
jgi:membrane fusion protein, heavy metal efflux system